VNVDLKKDVEQGMKIVTQFPDYEFRTTIQPVEKEKFYWLNYEEIGDIAKWIIEVTGRNDHKYFLQPFVAQKKEMVIDERFAKENLPIEFHKTPKAFLNTSLEEAQKYLHNAEIRA
jgi:hypothetical protein